MFRIRSRSLHPPSTAPLPHAPAPGMRAAAAAPLHATDLLHFHRSSFFSANRQIYFSSVDFVLAVVVVFFRLLARLFVRCSATCFECAGASCAINKSRSSLLEYFVCVCVLLFGGRPSGGAERAVMCVRVRANFEMNDTNKYYNIGGKTCFFCYVIFGCVFMLANLHKQAPTHKG